MEGFLGRLRNPSIAMHPSLLRWSIALRDKGLFVEVGC
jgi:hypothetical protein